MWWLAETVSNCLSTPACQSCPSLIPTPSSLVLLLQLLIIFSLNCRGQTTFSDGVVTLPLLLGKIFYLGKNTQPADMCSCFFGGKKNERDTLVLSFVLWYFYRFETMSFSCQSALKSKVTRQGGIVKMLMKSAVKEWTCVHILLCMHLKWKPFCTEDYIKKARDWSFCPWKLFKVINRQPTVRKTEKKSSTPTMSCKTSYLFN